jgi:hypothetical protein
MKLALAAVIVAVLPLVLPAAARADGITANCTAAGVTAPCNTGWYTSDVTVSFVLPAGSSNPQGCGNQTVNGDTSGFTMTCTVSVAGTQCCRLDVAIKRDATAPTATGIAAARGPDSNGWYNHAVPVTVSGTDATSGIASCTSTTYSGPDASSATVSGTCTDNAGNVSTSRTLSFPYDAGGPAVTAAPSRGADSEGWYNHPLDVSFSGSDSVSGIDSCTSGSYAGPDNGSASVTGTCRDKAGNTGSAGFALRYDATPPSVDGGTPDRPPDANGWYNHQLVVTFAGSDATSGIASCDTPSYDKPTDASASLSGRCRDNAGNASGPATFPFKFDSTPPKLGGVAVTSLDSRVMLTWKAGTDVAGLQVVRARGGAEPVTVYSGKRTTTVTDKTARNGNRYTYVITATDEAGNNTVVKAFGSPSSPLLAPRRAAHVRGRATLRWRPFRKAS